MLRKLSCSFLSFILLTMTLCINSYAIPEAPDISSNSAILIDADKGQILYRKDIDTKVDASLASMIMTVIIAIEKADLNSAVTISKEALNTSGPKISLQAGEKLTLSDLLYAAIMTSSNDAANAVAEYVGGSIDKFVTLMNDKAEMLKMENTNFTNPTGIYDVNQYTTAGDLSVLLKYCLKNDHFKEIFSTKGKPWANEIDSTVLMNQNKMFWVYDGIEGGCLTINNDSSQSSATLSARDDLKLIAIVLGSSEQSISNDTAVLFDYGFENYRRDILVPVNEPLKTIEIASKKVILISTENIYYVFPMGESFIEGIEFKIDSSITPPISKTQIVGTADYTLADGTIIKVSLYPNADISTTDNLLRQLSKKLLANKDLMIILLMLLVLELLILIYKIVVFFKNLYIKNRTHNNNV